MSNVDPEISVIPRSPSSLSSDDLEKLSLAESDVSEISSPGREVNVPASNEIITIGVPIVGREALRVLVVGDPHFKITNIRDTDPMSTAILNLARTTEPDFIVVLGDTLDRHESIHVSPLTRAITFLDGLSQISPVYLLIGNHDLKNNRQFLSDEHPFTALSYWGPRMTVVDRVIIATIKDLMFAFVPYVPPGRFIEALETVNGDWKSSSCIFAHQEFRGAKMGAITSVDGDDWPTYYPRIISGHIHDYQQPQPNIIYTGTPIQHSFGDSGNKTVSMLIFPLDPSVPNVMYHERVKLGLRKKKILRLSCEQVAQHELKDDADYKIIITGTSGELTAIKKHVNISKWQHLGAKVHYTDLIITDNNPTEILSVAPQKFSQVLYESIKSDVKLLQPYHKIFGAPTTRFVIRT